MYFLIIKFFFKVVLKDLIIANLNLRVASFLLLSILVLTSSKGAHQLADIILKSQWLRSVGFQIAKCPLWKARLAMLLVPLQNIAHQFITIIEIGDTSPDCSIVLLDTPRSIMSTQSTKLCLRISRSACVFVQMIEQDVLDHGIVIAMVIIFHCFDYFRKIESST